MNRSLIVPDDDASVVHDTVPQSLEDDPFADLCDRSSRVDPKYRAIYLGPIGTVLSVSPTKAFWRQVYRELGRTRRQLRKVFARNIIQDPDRWIDPANIHLNQTHHRQHRLHTFTGFLLLSTDVTGQPEEPSQEEASYDAIPLSDWPSREEVGYKPRRRGKQRKR